MLYFLQVSAFSFLNLSLSSCSDSKHRYTSASRFQPGGCHCKRRSNMARGCLTIFLLAFTFLPLLKSRSTNSQFPFPLPPRPPPPTHYNIYYTYVLACFSACLKSVEQQLLVKYESNECLKAKRYLFRGCE